MHQECVPLRLLFGIGYRAVTNWTEKNKQRNKTKRNIKQNDTKRNET